MPGEIGVQLLGVASYGIWCRHRSLTWQAQNKLAAAQTINERSMVNIKHKNQHLGQRDIISIVRNHSAL